MGDQYLTWALKTGDLDEVKSMMKTAEDANRTLEEGGRKPLHLACDFGQTSIVEFLLTMEADVNAADKHGLTPLIYACLEGHAACVKVLLEKGADKNLLAPDGKKLVEAVSDDNIKAMLK